MKIKIIGDKDPANPDQSHVEINQEQPQVDWQGQPTGAIEKINDINSAKYDTDIEDSYQSPTFRAKRLQQISEMMNKSQNLSPTMYQALFSEFSKSSDMAQETKDLISADIKRSQDAASQPPQPELPKPPSFSFSLKGEDLQTMAGLELVRAANLLPPDVIDKLEAQVMAQNNSGASGNNNANPVDPSAPFKIETHNADMELKKARLNGIHLENAQRMQKVATNEAEVEADLNDPRGLMPIASKILGRHPTAFEPLGVR